MFDISQVSAYTKKRLDKSELLISKNSKTGLSINTRIMPAKVKDGNVQRVIPMSCRPTQWCKEHCYARSGHFCTWGREDLSTLNYAQQAYLVNAVILHRFESAQEGVVAREADRIVSVATRKGYNNIRWNGGGDLSKGAVRLINLITKNHPKFIVWGFTKRADLVHKLKPGPNLRLTVSLDPTTPCIQSDTGSGFSLLAMAEAARHLDGRLAYATHIQDDPVLAKGELEKLVRQHGARLDTVFGFHRGVKHTEVRHIKECVATNPAVKNRGSCQDCRWCFMSQHERKKRKLKGPIDAIQF